MYIGVPLENSAIIDSWWRLSLFDHPGLLWLHDANQHQFIAS